MVSLRVCHHGLAGLESTTGVSRAATGGGSPSQTASPLGGDLNLPGPGVPCHQAIGPHKPKAELYRNKSAFKPQARVQTFK